MIAQESTTDTLALAVALGLLAGMRSATAPATLSAALAHGDAPHRDDPLVALAIRLRPLLMVFAAAELAADKLPSVPNRTSPPALVGRVTLGAASGALAARAYGGSVVVAALLAGAAAFAATFASFQMRRLTSERGGLSSTAAGLLEDAAVLAAASALARRG